MRGLAFLLLFLCLGWQPAQAAPTDGVTGPALEDMTWTELREQIRAGRTTVLIPIGGTEQSGPALTLGKHNVRVRILAGRIAAGLGDAIVAPVLPYVPEGAIAPPTSHMRFPGTISIPDATFEALLEAAAASLRVHGFRNVVLLGDHGGYQADLRRVAERLNRAWKGSGAQVLVPTEYYDSSSAGFAATLREHGLRDNEIGTHAGLADSSLQLALAPESVRAERLRLSPPPGAADGVYGGDPRRASAELGRLGADAIVTNTIAALRRTIGAR
ncbi:MAG: creatininase family protein [Pseudomonadota bacterium]|nr:creatininase family protein [Pseudomonadota bacterium]